MKATSNSLSGRTLPRLPLAVSDLPSLSYWYLLCVLHDLAASHSAESAGSNTIPNWYLAAFAETGWTKGRFLTAVWQQPNVVLKPVVMNMSVLS